MNINNKLSEPSHTIDTHATYNSISEAKQGIIQTLATSSKNLDDINSIKIEAKKENLSTTKFSISIEFTDTNGDKKTIKTDTFFTIKKNLFGLSKKEVNFIKLIDINTIKTSKKPLENQPEKNIINIKYQSFIAKSKKFFSKSANSIVKRASNKFHNIFHNSRRHTGSSSVTAPGEQKDVVDNKQNGKQKKIIIKINGITIKNKEISNLYGNNKIKNICMNLQDHFCEKGIFRIPAQESKINAFIESNKIDGNYREFEDVHTGIAALKRIIDSQVHFVYNTLTESGKNEIPPISKDQILSILLKKINKSNNEEYKKNYEENYNEALKLIVKVSENKKENQMDPKNITIASYAIVINSLIIGDRSILYKHESDLCKDSLNSGFFKALRDLRSTLLPLNDVNFLLLDAVVKQELIDLIQKQSSQEKQITDLTKLSLDALAEKFNNNPKVTIPDDSLIHVLYDLDENAKLQINNSAQNFKSPFSPPKNLNS